ncbi:MAG TPA: ligase-associated DNA damage response exonuclease [Vicinamibacterales bacterium]|nr:ligase-associated DNA damage response exonuclease [Vicinamibacterales bacterium]
MLVETPSGLYCPDGDFHVDPWGQVPRALITHAHGDHARAGSAAYLCTADTAALLARRFGPDAPTQTIRYGERLRLGKVTVSFHPAGHILGSAQIRIEGTHGVWVVAGDYKRAADPTCEPFEVVPCETFITESTFGLPIYRWDPAPSVIADLVSWWNENRDRGLTSVVFCYTIGKAQRLLAELAGVTDRSVLVHGMMVQAIELYRSRGVAMLPTQTLIDRPRGTSLAGELVLAPLSARGTPWMRRLGDLSDAFASGLMRVRGVRRQRAYDRGFVLSDHADWPALLDTISQTGAGRVIATHGHAEPFARYLKEQGVDAGVMRTAWEGETGADEGE